MRVGRLRTGREPHVAGAVLAAGLLVLAAALAVESIDRVIPSLFVDPYGDFSTVELPEWETERFDLSVGDRVVAVDGERLSARGPAHAGAELSRIVERAYARGRRSVVLEVDTSHGRRALQAPLLRVDSRAVAAFFGVYAGMGALFLWSGVYASRVAGRRSAARAYLLTSVASFVFLTTFFDYHTTRSLVPLFAASTAGLAFSLVWLAYAFPEPLPLGRIGRVALTTFVVVSVGTMLVLAISPLVGIDPRPVRLTVNVAVPASLATLALGMVLRLRRLRGHSREELETASTGLLVLPAIVAIGFAANFFSPNAWFHIALPLVGFIVPASVGRAFVRHNLFASGHVVSRRAMAVPAVLIAIVAGCVVALLTGSFDGPGSALRSPSAAVSGVGVGCLVLVIARSVFDRWMFAATSAFRPVVGELAGSLALETTREGVEEVLVEAARKWLPAVSIRAVKADAALALLPPMDERRLVSGVSVWTEGDAFHRDLVVPMTTDNRLHGALVLSQKRGGAPYTGDDVALLQTMAHLGALALRHLEAMTLLDEIRRDEVTTSRGEGRVAMDVVGAELAHELAYPLAFFRHLLSRLGPGNRVDDEDIEIGRDEVARMERMLASVRRLQMPPARCVTVNLRSVIDKALSLLRVDIEAKQLFVQVDVDGIRTVEADPDQLLQLLANLIRNGVQAAPLGGRVAIVARGDGDTVFEVRDDGPGVPDTIAGRLFSPFATTRADGTGLGLAVSKRIAETFEWEIDVLRNDGFTVFRVRRESPFSAHHSERVA